MYEALLKHFLLLLGFLGVLCSMLKWNFSVGFKYRKLLEWKVARDETDNVFNTLFIANNTGLYYDNSTHYIILCYTTLHYITLPYPTLQINCIKLCHAVLQFNFVLSLFFPLTLIYRILLTKVNYTEANVLQKNKQTTTHNTTTTVTWRRVLKLRLLLLPVTDNFFDAK